MVACHPETDTDSTIYHHVMALTCMVPASIVPVSFAPLNLMLTLKCLFLKS